MKKPSGRFLRHRSIQRETRRIFKILTEGESTEPIYLRKWERRNRLRVRLDISDRGMAPTTLVARAREYARRTRRRRHDSEYDEIWCVFDVDEHPNLQQAIEEARQSDINVAVSNPCIELWFVLHTADQTAWISRQDVQRRSNELDLTSGKRIPDEAWATLLDRVETAKQRAQSLDARHEGNGSPPRANPSTDVWRLVDRLRQGLGPTPEP